jgi:hypothetical protein
LGLGAAAVLLVGAVVLVAVSPRPRVPASPPPRVPASPRQPWFEDVAAAAGITFRHFDPATPAHYIHETLGSGLGWIDYDNDGWLDLFVVQDGPVRPAPGGPAPTNKLYRNNGNGTFTDVTEAVGLARAGFGMGCAVGDFDNDGFDDLLVTGQGGMTLYRNVPDNKGGRRFVDVTAAAGLDHNPHLATGCAWGDIDGDGLLDLYVCNYVEIDLDHYPDCGTTPAGLRRICSPIYFRDVTHRLYRNNGNGTFTDISATSGVAAVPSAPGLAVLMTDLDGDGKLDIYVANDLKASYLFHNQGGGRFVEKAVLSGCGLDASGSELAGMGIDAGDVDGSGRPSLFVTNFQNRPNVLYLNQGGLRFRDASIESGLAAPSLARLKFGTVFVDADLDGNLDVAVANGHIQRDNDRISGNPTAQEAQLFLGDGKGRFREVSSEAGDYFTRRFLGRGLAWADYDNDGRPDLAFSHNGGPVALLHNQTETPNHWLGLELVGDGKKSNRNAIGARVEIKYGDRTQVRFVNGGGSYLSANDRRVLAGLGTAPRAERVTVHWPSGRKQEFGGLDGGRWYRLQEGEKRAVVVARKNPL